MSRSMGVELLELRNGDRQHMVLIGALGGEEVTPREGREGRASSKVLGNIHS